VTGTEAYLRNKFRLDPSNHLTTVYTNVTERQDRQTDQTDRQDNNGPIK